MKEIISLWLLTSHSLPPTFQPKKRWRPSSTWHMSYNFEMPDIAVAYQTKKIYFNLPLWRLCSSKCPRNMTSTRTFGMIGNIRPLKNIDREWHLSFLKIRNLICAVLPINMSCLGQVWSRVEGGLQRSFAQYCMTRFQRNNSSRLARGCWRSVLSKLESRSI